MDAQAYDSMRVISTSAICRLRADGGSRKKEKVRARADLFCFSIYIQNSRLEEIKIGEVAVEVVWNQCENFGKG